MRRTIWSWSARAPRLGAALAVSLTLLSAPAAHAAGASASRADPQLTLVAERDTGKLRLAGRDSVANPARWKVVGDGPGDVLLYYEFDGPPGGVLHVADGQLRLGAVAPEDPAAGWLIEKAALPAQATAANGGKKNGHGSPPVATRPPSTTPPPPPPAAQALPNFPWPPPPATRIVLPRARCWSMSSSACRSRTRRGR